MLTAQKANCILVCIKTAAQGGDSAPLFCSCNTPPGELCPVQEILYHEGDEGLEEIAQRSCGCSIFGSDHRRRV